MLESEVTLSERSHCTKCSNDNGTNVQKPRVTPTNLPQTGKIKSSLPSGGVVMQRVGNYLRIAGNGISV